MREKEDEVTGHFTKEISTLTLNYNEYVTSKC